MNKQTTLSLISDELRQAATPKKELLERMDDHIVEQVDGTGNAVLL